MSSTTAPTTTLDLSGAEAVPFGRLVGVEWRKMFDTRAGRWLLGVTAALLLLAIGLSLLVVVLSDVAVTAQVLSEVLTIPLSLLLPVFAIVTVTSEWGQRTGLVTFALEPHRGRVLLAKLVCVLQLALATMVAAIVLGALENVVYGAITGNDVAWDLSARALLATVVSQLLYFLMAYALATVCLNSPGAIAIFYVVALLLPFFVYGPLFAFFDWARSVLPWIDLNFAFAPFTTPDEAVGGIDAARLLVAVGIWIVLPLVVGTLRVLRNEPK